MGTPQRNGYQMAESSRAPGPAPAQAGGASVGRPDHVTRLSGPADVITMIPYLFGFVPSESLVLVSLEGSRQRFGPCVRLDLVTGPAEVAEQAAYVSALALRQRFRRVMLIAFSDSVDPAKSVLDAVQAQLSTAGVAVLEAIRADGARWWSETCTVPGCCPAEGAPYDVETSRVAVEAVVAGLAKAPDRESLRAQVAALPVSRRTAVAAAADAIRSGSFDVEALVVAALERSGPLSVEEIATLASAVQAVSDRDRAWALMSRPTARHHFRVWQTVMQSVPDELLCPVGSLAAFAAWLQGSGVLASHAAERVLSIDPDYSMALLVVRALEACLHPDSWATVRPW